MERLEVYDGDRKLGHVCPSPKRRTTRTPIGFNSTGPNARIVFVRDGSQVSNSDPTWVYYKFGTNPDTVNKSEKMTMLENRGEIKVIECCTSVNLTCLQMYLSFSNDENSSSMEPIFCTLNMPWHHIIVPTI